MVIELIGKIMTTTIVSVFIFAREIVMVTA